VFLDNQPAIFLTFTDLLLANYLPFIHSNYPLTISHKLLASSGNNNAQSQWLNADGYGRFHDHGFSVDIHKRVGHVLDGDIPSREILGIA
jgi:hypothetical protein